MEMKTSMKIFLIPAIFFAVFFALAGDAKAERFFQKNSTWYEPIPTNPTITTNSANYVQDILINSGVMAANINEWSCPIWQATESTPITTVKVNSSLHKTYIEANEWNKVPIPSGALPAGNAVACSGEGWDGSMIVLSHNKAYAWEFYNAKYCSGSWSTETVRKWDISGDGINYPYDGHSSARFAGTPLPHGLITYNEVVNEGAINHAMAFSYNSAKYVAGGRYGVYPAGKFNLGTSNRTWALYEGMRLQLDPYVNCDTVSRYPFEKMVCVALQTYGMVFVENSGVGDNSIYAESVLHQPSKSWSGIITSDLSGIPINRLRVIDPVCSDCTRCPNCVASDTTPPAAPSGLTVQ